ncbi:hypothetical protein [Micromonospora craniellae]|uniref:Uncharacterized protein n=1 Tax=Micromonospora craniellae TaxID=2294034 RepID=A0A372FVV4_9ACTN|nr:hypothetical protein [Micromonospora craniellae]QOC93169.1 hypothetical protein ID554_05605 [Micromonospora craniellae]RFS44818.1 hypothetical protein D0Q02_20250 [Micromonospora craniellae]
MIMTQRLTDEEKLTLKTGAFGAVLMVSNAEPGLLAVFRESFAASGAISGASGVVREALTSGPLPKLPRDSALEIESVVLPALRRALGILTEKAPQDVGVYREVVLAAADRTARAHRGVSPAEAEAIDRIRDVLGESS